MREHRQRLFWLLAAAAVTVLFVLTANGHAAPPTTKCFPHGRSARTTVTMCITHLGHDYCRLIFKVTNRADGTKTWFGGKVRCGGGQGGASDPGDRRPL